MKLAHLKIYNVHVCVCAKSLQSCPTLCDPMDCSLPGSSVHKIFQARTLEWVAISSSSDLPNPGIEPESLMSSVLAAGFFTTSATWKAYNVITNRYHFWEEIRLEFFSFCDLVGIFKSYKNVYNFGSTNPASRNLLVGKNSREGGTFLHLFSMIESG